MGEASIRDLRNRGGEVIDRVLSGEQVIVTRDGRPVAELRPLPRPRLGARALVERFRALPPVDPQAFRADIDAILSQELLSRGLRHPRHQCSDPPPAI
ncbi:MAG: type II toxin-antitoxin system Phd/YefM family antitoxin [Acidimicrobiales bacterium]